MTQLSIFMNVLSEAQNLPPLGKADGSMPQGVWEKCRNWLSAAFLVMACRKDLDRGTVLMLSGVDGVSSEAIEKAFEEDR